MVNLDLVEWLYNRCKDLEQLWRNIKTKRHILTYRDKYRNEGQGEDQHTPHRTS